jgi:hypothetical protein
LFDTGGGQVKQNYYQGLYVMQMGFADTEFEELYNNKKLFTQVEHFFTLYGRTTDNINTIKQHNSILKIYPQYAQANISAKYPLSVLVRLPYFNKANFTDTEFVNIFSYSSLSVYLPIQRLLVVQDLQSLKKFRL